MMNSMRAAVYTSAAVALYVHHAGLVELTTEESIRLDRLTHSEAAGFTTERFGPLVEPGVTEVRLPAGVYHFRAAGDVGLRVDTASVDVAAVRPAEDKDPHPDSRVNDDLGPWPDPRVNGDPRVNDDKDPYPDPKVNGDLKPWPDPRAWFAVTPEQWAGHGAAFAVKGSGPAGRVPVITVTHGAGPR